MVSNDVLLPCLNRNDNFIWVRHGSSTKFGTGLKLLESRVIGKNPTIFVAGHKLGLQRSNIQICTHVCLYWSPSPLVLVTSPVASWSNVICAANRQLAVDVHIIVPFIEAKSSKIEKLLGFFFVLEFQSVIPGATGEWKTPIKLKLKLSTMHGAWLGSSGVAIKKTFQRNWCNLLFCGLPLSNVLSTLPTNTVHMDIFFPIYLLPLWEQEFLALCRLSVRIMDTKEIIFWIKFTSREITSSTV